MLEPDSSHEGTQEVPAEKNGQAPREGSGDAADAAGEAAAKRALKKKRRRQRRGLGAHLKGSVPGHLPTHSGANLSPPGQGDNPEPSPASIASRFQPGHRHGYHAKSKERECMEAVQNGGTEKALAARFPIGMVKRLMRLQEAAEDVENPHCIHAQRMIREILSTLTSTKAEREAEAAAKAAQPRPIMLFRGRIDAPMPGAPKPQSGA